MNLFRIEVAIKEGTSEDSRDDMLEEAKAMIKVPKHDHIVNFHGISMHDDQVYVLLEFCTLGSLEKYLRKDKENLTFFFWFKSFLRNNNRFWPPDSIV